MEVLGRRFGSQWCILAMAFDSTFIPVLPQQYILVVATNKSILHLTSSTQ